MQAAGSTQKGTHPGIRRDFSFPAFSSLLSFSCFLFLTGCAGTHNGLTTDPLLGKSGGVPIGPKQVAAPPASPLPPLPAPNAIGSTAALAGGGAQTVDGRHSLQIDNPAPQPIERPLGQPVSNGGAILQRPELIPPEPTPRMDGGSPVNVGLAAGTRVAGYEQAQAQLTARGILWQRLEFSADQAKWKFSCSIPNRQNRNISRTYEALADSDLAALQAVIDLIDKEK